MNERATQAYAYRLGSKALRLIAGNASDSVTEGTARVLEYADLQIGIIGSEIEEQVRLGLHKPIACKKGCAHCCHTHVEATQSEIEVLSHYVLGNFSSAELKELNTRLEAHRLALSVLQEQGDPRPPMACPLLVDDCCTAHSARPLACRAFNSVDNEVCEQAKLNWRNPPKIPASGKQVFAAGAISGGLMQGLSDRNANTDMLEMPMELLRQLGG